MDFVFWDSLENAESASEKVKHIQQNENFNEYINAFEKVEIFADFNLLSMWNNN